MIQVNKSIEEIPADMSIEQTVDDLIKRMFVESRGIWVLPGSLSVFMCDGLEGLFVLLLGSPQEESTKETIAILEKLGYEVEIKSPPHDDNDMALKDILNQEQKEEVMYLRRMLSAEDRTLSLFMEHDNQKDIIRSAKRYFEDMRNEGSRAEVERVRRFIAMLEVTHREIEKKTITSFAYGGKL